MGCIPIPPPPHTLRCALSCRNEIFRGKKKKKPLIPYGFTQTWQPGGPLDGSCGPRMAGPAHRDGGFAGSPGCLMNEGAAPGCLPPHFFPPPSLPAPPRSLQVPGVRRGCGAGSRAGASPLGSRELVSSREMVFNRSSAR